MARAEDGSDGECGKISDMVKGGGRQSVKGSFVLLILSVLPFVPSAHGQELTGNTLYDQCSANPHGKVTSESDLCAGYVTRTFRLLVEERQVCPSPAITNEKVVAVVLQYLKDSPAVRDRSAAALIWQSLNTAYPCKARSFN
jgi:hypothetical protein